jgi:organic hydroperoxide reductase OsmC/OhrA
VVEATAAPDIVPPPWSEPVNVDPEQAFVASLASCHMLFFLSLAARNGHPVESYQDQAEGIMEKNAAGRGAITRVTLRPRINFGSDSIPDTQQVEDLHEAAHQRGFIANSVTTRITIESSHSSVGNG